MGDEDMKLIEKIAIALGLAPAPKPIPIRVVAGKRK